MSMLFLEATKWTTVWPVLSAGKHEPGASSKRREGWEVEGNGLTLLIRVCALAQQELDEPLAVLDAGRDHERRPADLILYARCFSSAREPPRGNLRWWVGSLPPPASAYSRTCTSTSNPFCSASSWVMSSWFADAAQWIGSRPSSSLRLASVGSACGTGGGDARG